MLLYYIILCFLYWIMSYYIINYIYFIIVYYIIWYYIILYYDIIYFYIIFFYICYTILYYVLFIESYDIILFYFILCDITLCDIVFCFTIIHNIYIYIYILLLYIIPYHICRDLPRPCNSLSAKTWKHTMLHPLLQFVVLPPSVTSVIDLPQSLGESRHLNYNNCICIFVIRSIHSYLMWYVYILCMHIHSFHAFMNPKHISLYLFFDTYMLRSSNQNGPLDWSWTWQLTLHISPN